MNRDKIKELGISEDKIDSLLNLFKQEIESVKEGVKNDPEFIQSIQSAEYAKNMSDFERVMRQKAEVDLDKINPDLKGVKKIKAIADLVLKSIESTKDETAKEWQEKAISYKEELDRFKEEELPAALQNQKAAFFDKFNKSAIKDESSKIETIGGAELKVFAFQNYLNKNGLKQVWNEEQNTFDVVTKEGNLKPTKEGKTLTKEDIFVSAFEDAEILKKSNGTDIKKDVNGFNVKIDKEKQPSNHFQALKERMLVER